MVVSVRTVSIIDVNGEKGMGNGWTLNDLSSGKYSTFDSIWRLASHFCSTALI